MNKKIRLEYRIKLMKWIEGLSESYMENMRLETLSYKLANSDENKILNSWWISLVFFFDRIFYQGRRDVVSSMFEKATIKALEELLGDTDIEKIRKLRALKDQGCLEWKEYKKCPSVYDKLSGVYLIDDGKKKSKTGKQRDQEMVVDTLKFVVDALEKYDHNILKYAIDGITHHKIKEVKKKLIDIRQVGDKTASLFLRDAVAVYNLEKEVKFAKSDYTELFPVDTWVRQVSEKLEITSKENSITELKESIIDMCTNARISPIKFNQGAWYLGTHPLEVIFDHLQKS